MTLKRFCDYCGAEVDQADVVIKGSGDLVAMFTVCQAAGNGIGGATTKVDVCRECAVDILTGSRSPDPSKEIMR